MMKVLPLVLYFMERDFQMYTFANVTEWIFTVPRSFQSSGYIYYLIFLSVYPTIRKVSLLRNFDQQEKVNGLAKIL
jgi:hypothetical protein